MDYIRKIPVESFIERFNPNLSRRAKRILGANFSGIETDFKPDRTVALVEQICSPSLLNSLEEYPVEYGYRFAGQRYKEVLRLSDAGGPVRIVRMIDNGAWGLVTNILGRPTDPFTPNKIYNHPNEINGYLFENGNPAPVTLEFDATNKCQLNCSECTFKERDRSLENNPGVVKGTIEQVRGQGGAKGITWTGGGEPLLMPEIGPLMKFGFDLGAENGLITNGLALNNEDIIHEIFPLLRWARISMDAGTPDTYAAVHGTNPRAFDNLLKNIDRSVSIRDKSGYPLSIGVSFLTSKRTQHDMEPAAALAKELGLDYIQFKPLQIHAGTWAYTYEDQSFARLVQPRLEAMQTDDFRVYFPKDEFYKGAEWKPGFCYGQQFSTSVAADGKVYTCCHFKGNPDYMLGDLNENKNFFRTWDSERREQLLKRIDWSNCVPWCKNYQLNNRVETIKTSGEPLKDQYEGDGQTLTYPLVLHRNFL